MKIREIKNAKDLGDFVEILKRDFPQDHSYRCHMDLIKENMKPGYTYKELGSLWGYSAALAVLAGASELHVVDIDMAPFNHHKKYFEDALKKVDGKLVQHEYSSLDDRCVSPCDAMLIDSLHKWDHVYKELELHSSSVKDWIVFHDTHIIYRRNQLGEKVPTPSPIGPGIRGWLLTEKGSHWEFAEETPERCGAMMIRRKK
tara:strand:- start:656 stop:1258 length:603 start_codon:yes stop_codon:yes gene_type:complete